MHSKSLYAIALCVALPALDRSASADILYLQNFAVGSGGMTPLPDVNWAADYGNSTATVTPATTGNGSVSPNAQISGGPSAKSSGGNVNAAVYNGVTSTTYGFVPLVAPNANNQFVAYTNEYTINTSIDTPTTFSWYAGSYSAGDSQQLVIEIGGAWYASTATITPVSGVTAGSSFGSAAVHYTTPFSTSASAWQTLTFSTTSTSDLALGPVLSSALPSGNITGFGIYLQFNSSDGSNSRSYFDSFEVDGVPEPVGAGIALAGIAGCLIRRGRRT